ncbi:MAG TPA: hypothetical protein VFT93_04545 [Candidatus Eisenbacteria bacterium]|nr:hypothetical protein [Candidatus Eisenbacteria bacterium]
MIRLSESHLGTFRDLAKLGSSVDLSLIGALALACALPRFRRQTNDVDIMIALPLDEANAALARLPGWTRAARSDFEWRSASGTLVHAIPLDASSRKQGFLIWPASGRRMSLVGMRHAFENTNPLNVARGVTVRSASVPAVILMKSVAYQDRPRERERDVDDFATVMDVYVDDVDTRRWDEAQGVTREDVGAYLLGKDVGRIADAAERKSIEGFVRLLLDGAGLATLVRVSPPLLRSNPRNVRSRLEAFRQGLLAGA